MNLKILEQEVAFKNERASVEMIMETINQTLQIHNCLISHIVADGQEVIDDYEDYLNDHISSLNIIEVVVLTKKQWLDGMLISAISYLTRNILAIQVLIDDFYRGPSSETWTEFNNLLEALQWLDQLVHEMENNVTIYKSWDDTLSLAFDFRELIQGLSEAVINSDPVAIADALNYEIIPLFETLTTTIQKTIDTEVIRNDLN
jgi:hypothetical protein